MAATAQQTAIINLYAALFDRAPDADGLNFWTQALIDGASLSTITQSFLGTPEAQTIYPASQTSEQFISAFYQAVFGRPVDASGLTFWTDALNAAGGANSEAAKALVVSQINDIVSTPLSTKPANLTDAEYAETLADRATFANKVAVGVYFAVDTKSNDIALAKQALAGVTADAASVDAAKQVIDTPAGGTPTVPTVPVTTHMGTEGNDVFDFTHLNVKAGDVIDGLGGNDTLNYVDSSTTAVTFPAATVRNVETINISNVNTTGISVESVHFYNLKSMSYGQTLTVAGVTITAEGIASPAEIAAAIASGQSVGNAAYSGSLVGYQATQNGNTINFVSTVKGNVPDLTATGTGAVGTYMMYSQGRSGVLDTVAADGFVGATSFNSDRSIAAVAFTGLKTGQSVGLIGDKLITTRDLSATYANEVTTATVNVDGGAKGGVITLNGAGLTDITINSTGDANTLSGVKLSANTTSLHIHATTNLNAATITGVGLKTIVVAGDAASVNLGTLSSTILTSIDASGLSAGGALVTIGAAPAATFKGGAGKDVISIAAGAVITSDIDGGAGDADVVAFVSGASLTAGTAAHISNVEVAQLGADFGTTETYDVSLLDGVNTYHIASDGSVALTQLDASKSIVITGHIAGDEGLSISLADTQGGNDVADITLDYLSEFNTAFGLTISTIKAVGVETLRLHSLGAADDSVAFTGNYVSNNADNTSLSSIIIDGTKAIRFETGSLIDGVGLTIDASAATGVVVVAGTDATKRLDIIGGSASDEIRTGAAGSSVFGGQGGDNIILSTAPSADIIKYTEASESKLDVVNEAGTASAKMDTITGFQPNIDKIDLTSLFDRATTEDPFFDKVFSGVAELLAAEADSSFYGVEGTNRVAIAAHIGADTYLVVDADQNGIFNAATDLVIKLAGVSGLDGNDLLFTFVV